MMQMVSMYSYSEDRELDRMKFLANLLGAELKGEDKTESSTSKREPRRGIQGDTSFTLFKHPSEYKHLSKEQRDKLTRQMMGVHRQAMSKMPKQMGKG